MQLHHHHRSNLSTPNPHALPEETNMTEFEGRVLADLSVLKNQMQHVIGDGNQGRMGQIEDRVLKHDQTLQRIRGSAAAFGGLLTLVHVAIDYIAAKR